MPSYDCLSKYHNLFSVTNKSNFFTESFKIRSPSASEYILQKNYQTRQRPARSNRDSQCGDHYSRISRKHYYCKHLLCKADVWLNVRRNSVWIRKTNQMSFFVFHGRTTYQPDLTIFLQPRHIPTQGYNITQSSAPDDGHMVARKMLSNYQKRNKEYKK